jgi:arylsulfatase A-like enzyme
MNPKGKCPGRRQILRAYCRQILLFIPAVLLVMGRPMPLRAETTDRRPNVLILFVDQLRWSEVGCYGNAVIKTPKIDELAGQSARFASAFTNFPSCSPARSTLFSGRYARSNGLYKNQSGNAGLNRPTNRDKTIAEAFSAAGYTTALIGKWHLTPNPQALGFQRSWRAEYGKGYFKTSWLVDEKPDSAYVYDGYTLEHEAELAKAFLRDHRDKPFLLALTPSPPHMPLIDLPERYKQMYKPADMPLRPNVWKDGQLAYDQDWFMIYLWDGRYYGNRAAFTEKLPAGTTLREIQALYYGQTTAADDWAGSVLATVRKMGLDSNTIVVFSSDHGDLLGSHHLYNKNEHYDEASRIPLLVRWPGKIPPKVIDRQVVSLVDLMPTVLDLCGVPIPASVQGTSVADVLTAKRQTVGDNAAYIETTQNEGVRTLNHVYYRDRNKLDGEHFFDVEKDPYEMTDRIADPAYAAAIVDLRARTQRWRERTPSVQPVPVPNRPRTAASRRE